TFYNTVYNTNGFFGNVITDISNTQFANAQYRSDYYIENASFFKMDFMSAGYSFENVMGSKVRGRVGLTVRNAFFITKYKGLDPEVGGGIDNNIYPRARVFMLNLSLTF
ncbi:MAG: SusC/RagA family protein, partial [Bacteroidota bacterium]